MRGRPDVKPLSALPRAQLDLGWIEHAHPVAFALGGLAVLVELDQERLAGAERLDHRADVARPQHEARGSSSTARCAACTRRSSSSRRSLAVVTADIISAASRIFRSLNARPSGSCRPAFLGSAPSPLRHLCGRVGSRSPGMRHVIAHLLSPAPAPLSIGLRTRAARRIRRSATAIISRPNAQFPRPARAAVARVRLRSPQQKINGRHEHQRRMATEHWRAQPFQLAAALAP